MYMLSNAQNVTRHVIWIVTDSARNFSTGGLDDRDRPEFYDSLLGEFTNFENAVTSAPSSVMSGSCMLTGMNSYYIGRNYDDFRFEEGAFPNIAAILSSKGYETKGIFVAREMREKIAPFIGHLERRYWPDGLSHAQRMWSNEDANRMLNSFLGSRDATQPLFLMLWNNIRHDDRISDNLAELMRILKEHGYYEESLVLFCADHGYPHPRRGFTPEFLKREGLTHDLMLGDDNILIPLLVKTPDNKPGSVATQVGTVDLFPTVLDYAGVTSYRAKEEFPQSGRSLRSLLTRSQEGQAFFDQRAIRCDCRFFGQTQRKTALRLGRYKYVFSHDDGFEEFYDTVADPSEGVSLFDRPEYANKIAELRAVFQTEEAKASQFQQEYIARKVVRSFAAAGLRGPLVVFSLQEQQMNDCVMTALASSTGQRLSAFVGDSSQTESFIHVPETIKATPCAEILARLKAEIRSGAKAVFLSAPEEETNKSYLRALSEAGIRIHHSFDINFQSSAQIEWGLARYWRALKNRKMLIINEPKLALTYAREFVARIRRKMG